MFALTGERIGGGCGADAIRQALDKVAGQERRVAWRGCDEVEAFTLCPIQSRSDARKRAGGRGWIVAEDCDAPSARARGGRGRRLCAHGKSR